MEKLYENNLFINEDTIFEDATYDKEHSYPIFIILMHSGTLLANAIKQVTRAEYSHACISFNSALNPMYSFGGKTREEGFGFVVQDPKDKFYKDHHAKFSVYCMYVSKEARDAMKQRLSYFRKNKNKMKYDCVGLAQVFFNMKTDYKQTKYFCSRFVIEIISSGTGIGKDASLWKPEDIKQLTNISLVQQGNDFYKYSKNKTEKVLEKIRKSSGINENTELCESLIKKYKSSHPGLYKVLKEDGSFMCKNERDVENMKGMIEFCNKSLSTLMNESKIISSPIMMDIEGKIKIIEG